MSTYRPRRGLIGGLALTVAVTGLTAVATGGAAHAAPHYQSVRSVQIGWTDSATPGQPYDAGNNLNMPLGTSVDEHGQSHTSRVYATFDLSGLKGDKIYGGTVSIQEASAPDCTKRAIEIWRTKPVRETPAWESAPMPLVKLDEILTPEYCPSADISFDVGTAVEDAVEHKQKRITFELRVPAQFEADPAYARQLNWYRTVRLTVQHNSLPKIDNGALFNGGFACDREAPYRDLGRAGTLLQAVGTDADGYDEFDLRAEFAIWPTDAPDARTLLTNEHGRSGRATGVTVPQSVLADGRPYAWQARVSDGADFSEWSKPCFFTYDGTPPPQPTVTSANYPQGGRAPIGEPGVFTFSDDGNPDIAGFHYTWDEFDIDGCEYSGDFGQLVCTDPFDRSNVVRADVAGGSATVTLNPPASPGAQLSVRAVDLAGNSSRPVVYETQIPWTAPEIQVMNGTPRWGQEVRLKLTPANGLTGVREYRITVDGENVTQPAEPDGTATFSFTADNVYGPSVTVHSVGANGFVSHTAHWSTSFPQWPAIDSDLYRSPADEGPVGGVGVETTFTFSPPPGWSDTVSYEYFFYYHGGGDGEGPTQVAAGADGTAAISWAPQHSGYVDLFVHAIRADGSMSETNASYIFEVAETA